MLEIKNLFKSYDGKMVIKNLNLQIKEGERVALMGPSGSGKSTVLRCLNRLIRPDSGSIWLGGQNILQLKGRELNLLRRKIGFVFQKFNLLERLTALENVAFPLLMTGLEKEEAYRLAAESLKEVGLEGYKDFPVPALSGGQQQRVGIARALAVKPEILLLDEPTASLDPILVQEVLEVIERLGQERSITMVIVTHEIFFALRFADRLLLFDRGEIVDDGSPEAVLSFPRSSIGQKYKDLLEYQWEEKINAAENY